MPLMFLQFQCSVNGTFETAKKGARGAFREKRLRALYLYGSDRLG